MNKSKAKLYAAHNRNISQEKVSTEKNSETDYIVSLSPEEAAGYIADLLSSLGDIARKAHLSVLFDLIKVAEEEARMHGMP
jgi:hypothetical protein